MPASYVLTGSDVEGKQTRIGPQEHVIPGRQSERTRSRTEWQSVTALFHGHPQQVYAASRIGQASTVSWQCVGGLGLAADHLHDGHSIYETSHRLSKSTLGQHMSQPTSVGSVTHGASSRYRYSSTLASFDPMGADQSQVLSRFYLKDALRTARRRWNPIGHRGPEEGLHHIMPPTGLGMPKGRLNL